MRSLFAEIRRTLCYQGNDLVFVTENPRLNAWERQLADLTVAACATGLLML